jgi:hypothetical protein
VLFITLTRPSTWIEFIQQIMAMLGWKE